MLEHHAYLVRQKEVSFDAAKTHIEKLQVAEVRTIDLPSFGIDDVRDLTQKAYMRPQVGDSQLVVVVTSVITTEAQQALLKILEEPPRSTAFLFCVPETLYLLPTLLSRFLEYRVASDPATTNDTFRDWSMQTVPLRLASITKHLTAKDTVFVSAIKSGLLFTLTTNKKVIPAKDLPALYFIAEHLETRGASNKLLLEELALTLPLAAE